MLKLMQENVDSQTGVKCGIMAAVALASAAASYFHPRKNDSSKLKYESEGIMYDSVLCESFLALQQYEALSPYHYEVAFHLVDSLLFLEHQLLSGKIDPRKDDKNKAAAMFRRSALILNEFQDLIRDKMGIDYAFAANTYIQRIYEQSQKHFLTILSKCRVFQPEKLIKHAPKEIERIMRTEGKRKEKHMEYDMEEG